MADSLTAPLVPLEGEGEGEGEAEGRELLLPASASAPPSSCGSSVWLEVKKQLTMAAPMIGVNVFQFSLTTVSVMFVGHLDELSLASASIATSFGSVSGFSVMIGLGSGLETLCGQAYGARQYRMLGVYMQRGVVVLLATALVVTVLWYNMGSLLRLAGQDAEISDKAGEYARWLIPIIYAWALLQPMQKFLQTQSIIVPMLVFVVITMALHVPLCWLLIFKLGVGYRGAALASGISAWLNTIFIALYIKFAPACKRTWTGFSRDALQDFTGFFKLAVPSAVMVCLEWWSFELLVILSGLLPNPQLELSALSICMNTISLAYMIPYGLSTAASTRISNELGAGRPTAAKFAVVISLTLALATAITISTTLFSIRNVWGWAFSNEEEVTAYVATMMPFLSALTLMDSIQAVCSGVARGCGWQLFGAFANLGAYYIVGLPIALTLAFVYHLNGRGLWMGMLGGIATQTISLLLLTIFTNWDKQAENAQARVYGSVSATLPVTVQPPANGVQQSPYENGNGLHQSPYENGYGLQQSPYENGKTSVGDQ